MAEGSVSLPPKSAARLVFSLHQRTTQSLRFSTNCVHWLKAPEKIGYKLADIATFALDSAIEARAKNISVRLSIFFDSRSSSLSVIIITDRLSYSLHSCRLSATELSQSPLPSCLERTAAPRHVCTALTLQRVFCMTIQRFVFSHRIYFPDILSCL